MKNINQSTSAIKYKNISWKQYQINYQKTKQQKIIQDALIFLKLRDYGCPKKKALHFVQKKQNAIDTTKRKHGPPGFQILTPQKSSGILINGWVKGQKLHFRNLQGINQQTAPQKSQKKLILYQKNKKSRAQLQQIRLRLKKNKQTLIDTTRPKILLQQISSMKDKFIKENEKKNIFFSCNGVKLNEHTRNYLQNIQFQSPDSLIMQLDAFNTPSNDQQIILESDNNNIKWRSQSVHQIQGEVKRKKLVHCRKFISNIKINQNERFNKQQQKFRNTLRNSLRKHMWESLDRPYNKKNIKQSKQFYDNIQKMAFLKSKQIQIEVQPLNNVQCQ